MTPLAARLLRAAREEVARRVAAGARGAAIDADRLAAEVAADPASHALIDAAVAAARRADPGEAPPPPPGARATRRDRVDGARAAIDELLLAGELAPDGPGRVVLPGFGPSTWRALALLRAGAGGADRAWARAIAGQPLADIGLIDPPARPTSPAGRRRARLARAVLAREAERQDLRDALLRAEAASEHAEARGLDDAVATIAADRRRLEAALAACDAAVASLWDEGRRQADAAD